MSAPKILIVEDEILIADMLKRYLEKKSFQVVGIAISYEEAIELYEKTNPDLALLDIRINGRKSGVDVAFYIQEHKKPVPFIYLTSQLDIASINAAKKTYPSGYLSKPFHKENLFANIEIALHKSIVERSVVNDQKSIIIEGSSANYSVILNDILFIQAEHIYKRIFLLDGEEITERGSIKEMITQLPDKNFIQTHRSYIVNKLHVKSWDSQFVYIRDHEIPISRSKKKEVIDLLKIEI